MPSPTAAVSQRLEWARQIAQEAGDITLKFFRSNTLGVERKGDGSPVTVADRTAEEHLRKRISEQFPEDAILGEEFPEKPGTSGYKWILDPIDGTKSFIHGVALYTTLVAVLEESDGQMGEPLLGVIHSPATRETVYAAVGGGAWYTDGDAKPVQARVSETATLAEGLFLTTDVDSFSDRAPDAFSDRATDAADVYLALQKAARLARTWGDAYGYMMVALGRAEVMMDPEMSVWDTAALKPILEEAGGTFTDWQGKATVHSREAIATNGRVAEAVLSLTRGR